MQICPERPEDIDPIRALITAAFRDAAQSSRTEAAIVDALRAGEALSPSLVAVGDGVLLGHVAFSPVRIDGEERNWHGLGPVSVRPERQRQGIGQALIRAGLERLERSGAAGCVVLGDPAYYRRFGFVGDAALRLEGVPAGYFQSLAFAGHRPHGVVSYHPAFGVGS